MSYPVLSFDNIGFAYPGGPAVLKNLSCTIGHGESVGIVGANGAGKSTLLLMLSGVLLPDHGSLHVGEIPVAAPNLPQIRQKIGFVFQNPDDQLFMPSVYEDVAFGPRNYGLAPAEVEKRVMQSLTTVGIPHLKDRPPYRLSGGEKKAAAIASILAMQPEILVMDEPTAALDPGSRRRFIQLVRGFSQTKIIASHDMDMVMELCERTIILKDGMIARDGSTFQIMSDATLLKQCNLEMPLTLQSCARCGQKKN
jgi:cobalt/nickel transport system ATP-binding protein